MIYRQPPADFQPRFDVVSCFFQYEDKILLLRRTAEKVEPGKWSLPAGKVDAGETALQGMIREAQEETGCVLAPEQLHQGEEMIYVRYPEFDFRFTMFATSFITQPAITLTPAEHTDFCWVTVEKALQMDLIRDEAECMRIFYKL